MPAATGAIFLLPFFLSVWLLKQVPQPSQADIDARVEREPMNHANRLAFVKHFLPGLVLLFTFYFFLFMSFVIFSWKFTIIRLIKRDVTLSSDN